MLLRGVKIKKEQTKNKGFYILGTLLLFCLILFCIFATRFEGEDTETYHSVVEEIVEVPPPIQRENKIVFIDNEFNTTGTLSYETQQINEGMRILLKFLPLMMMVMVISSIMRFVSR